MINAATAGNGDPITISEAEDYLAEGETLRMAGVYKDAVNKFKDALAKAESVLP